MPTTRGQAKQKEKHRKLVVIASDTSQSLLSSPSTLPCHPLSTESRPVCAPSADPSAAPRLPAKILIPGAVAAAAAAARKQKESEQAITPPPTLSPSVSGTVITLHAHAPPSTSIPPITTSSTKIMIHRRSDPDSSSDENSSEDESDLESPSSSDASENSEIDSDSDVAASTSSSDYSDQELNRKKRKIANRTVIPRFPKKAKECQAARTSGRKRARPDYVIANLGGDSDAQDEPPKSRRKVFKQDIRREIGSPQTTSSDTREYILPAATPPPANEVKIIEKVLTRRETSTGFIVGTMNTHILGPEYFVKYRGLSFLHAEWVPESLFTGEHATKLKLHRFLKHYIPNVDDEEELFATDYTQALLLCFSFTYLPG